MCPPDSIGVILATNLTVDRKGGPRPIQTNLTIANNVPEILSERNNQSVEDWDNSEESPPLTFRQGLKGAELDAIEVLSNFMPQGPPEKRRRVGVWDLEPS